MTYYIECKDQTNAAELECLINSGEKYKATQEDCLVRFEKIETMRKLESDYERGMREAMKDIAKSCGKTFSVDIGYLELPKLVDSMVNKDKPKPRTKVVYELVNGMQHLSDYFLVHESDGLYCFCPTDDKYKLLTNDGVLRSFDLIKPVYRKVEKEIDWKDGLIAFLNKEKKDGGYVSGWAIGDNEDEFSTVDIDFSLRDGRFIAMCHLVASLTDKPE